MAITSSIRTEHPYEEIRQLFATELARKHERSTIELAQEHSKAVFNITASDVTALRAATNTVTSVLSVYEKTKEVLHDATQR